MDSNETTPEYEAPQVTDVEDLLGLMGGGGISGVFTHSASVTN